MALQMTETPMRAAFTALALILSVTVVARAQTPAVRKAGETNKSVQVLKDIPSTQLIPTMRVVAASLGVECEYCHRPNRADETEHKQTARKMMAMVIALNERDFAGQTKVTCYTCHRGSHEPLSAPIPTGQYTSEGVGAIFKGNGNPVPGGNDEVLSERYAEHLAEETRGLPTPDQLLAKYARALGGEAALRKVTSRRITASMEMSPDVRGVAPTLHALTQQVWKAPNQWSTTYTMANGVTAKGFDGNVAWAQDLKGVVTETTGAAPAPPLARVKRNSDFYEPLNIKQGYMRMETRGRAKVGEREAYVVVGFPAGDLPEQLYFDAESGLLVRKLTATPTALGDYSLRTDYEDYRDVGGVKVPYAVKTIGPSPADTTAIFIEKVENDPPLVDAAKFAKPASK